MDRFSPDERGGPLAGAFVMVLLGAACNPLFGIHEGSPRPICVGTEDTFAPLIDDMEDGDGFICPSSTRHGHWFTISDQTPGADLTPAGDFDPTPIPGGRGPSQYAAHLTGSGFAEWGALMGFNLNERDTLEDVVIHYEEVFKRVEALYPPPQLPHLLTTDGVHSDRPNVPSERAALVAYLGRL